MTPVEGSREENKSKVFWNLYGGGGETETDEAKAKANQKVKFKVGDNVRIAKYRTTFRKGYRPNFTSEVFKIIKVYKTEPVTYAISDKDDEVIDGKFYSEELVLVL